MRIRRYFEPGKVSTDGWRGERAGRREWESSYRDRWAHEKVVRTTHGVNCTGSCSWQVYVKDGLITWETQAVDYPSTEPELPDHEPRGCPRGASFSWYTYSPLRVRYPYVRGTLLQLYREALQRLGDPVAAWAALTGDPDRARSYKSERGKGGFVRASWDEVLEIIAAAHVHTIKTYGPDRVAGFSPIPAMSMASYAAGTRFLSLIGGVVLSFYDWYADLPPASPQVFGDQTDVPESADWYNAAYLILWGSNVPITRTPDAHFMTEARYRGQKVVVVSPDYSDHTRFADDWLPAHPGTDGALAMAMGHVILKEYYLDRQVERFTNYAKKYTDLPFLVKLEHRGDAFVASRFLRASDLSGAPEASGEHADWKTVVFDSATATVAVPNGSIGFRHGDGGKGRWNLELGAIDPALSLYGRHDRFVSIDLPRFDASEPGKPCTRGTAVRRGVPAAEVGGQVVTTVFDLLLAQYAVGREGLPGEWPEGYDDPGPCTPAWAEAITSVPREATARIAREFARTAEVSGGRCMILMGAGTNHWYHSDLIYRTFLALTTLCGCEGINGGGWAHYVGQEKVRPFTGFATLAFAADWVRPTRHQATTPFWYLTSDQWRYEGTDAGELASVLGTGSFQGRTFADCYALAARLGWIPAHPDFDINPLNLVDQAEAARQDPEAHVLSRLRDGSLRFACEDPDGEGNYPRVLTVWRANILGSSGKGREFFLHHLLGAEATLRASECPPERRPVEIKWRDPAPKGKLDLLTTIDFRMSGNALFSDIVLPAATWYEKHDLSSTDLHPFVHAFSPAIAPPWETRSDWDIFVALSRRFSRLAQDHLGVRRDIVCVPLLHDTPDELAQPSGEARDWRAGECEVVPGQTMGKLVVVERDYPAVGDKMTALGPLVESLGTTTKGVTLLPNEEVGELGARHGVVPHGPATGRPVIASAEHACEVVLALSGTTNGRLASAGFQALERRCGVPLTDLGAVRSADRITFADTRVQPRTVITSPEWSGIEAHGRRYSPFTINVERLKPWHTLTGRQHLYLDHAWIREFGEQLPTYRPAIEVAGGFGNEAMNEPGHSEVRLRYLTPHSKWSIHSEYQDNLHMLTLFRGGPVVWMSPADAERVSVSDNDWVEVYNRNGVVAARAVVTHRVPKGTAMMYHAQDSHVNVPRSEISGKRGGTDNSLTRIVLKPTHMIGGYAQLTWGFNYYGPTGGQRDEVVTISRRKGEVVF